MAGLEVGRVKLIIHLNSGGQIVAWVDDDEECSALDEALELISNPPKPHWVEIGDCIVFTQAIAGIEEA